MPDRRATPKAYPASKPDDASADFLLPQPDATGIGETRELYRRRTGREITEGEAADILGLVMRHIYLIGNTFLCTPPSGSASTHESPTTTDP